MSISLNDLANRLNKVESLKGAVVAGYLQTSKIKINKSYTIPVSNFSIDLITIGAQSSFSGYHVPASMVIKKGSPAVQNVNISSTIWNTNIEYDGNNIINLKMLTGDQSKILHIGYILFKLQYNLNRYLREVI